MRTHVHPDTNTLCQMNCGLLIRERMAIRARIAERMKVINVVMVGTASVPMTKGTDSTKEWPK